MFPRIIRSFDPFVVAEIYSDEERNQPLALRLAGKISQPVYLVIDPETEDVLREWGYSEGQTPERFEHQLEEGLRVFRSLRL